MEDADKKIQQFEEANRQYRERWTEFEEKFEREIALLESLREERNVKLDEAKRALREQSKDEDAEKSVESGPFTVTKKLSISYDKDKLIPRLKSCGLYHLAVTAGMVQEKVELAKYAQIRNFLDKHTDGADAFEDCVVSEETSSAIYGPKTIPPLGTESKE